MSKDRIGGFEWDAYISCASNTNSLELTTVELLNCSLEIIGSFELNKASILWLEVVILDEYEDLPFAITVTASFGIDDVKAGLTGEIFQILNPEST